VALRCGAVKSALGFSERRIGAVIELTPLSYPKSLGSSSSRPRNCGPNGVTRSKADDEADNVWKGDQNRDSELFHCTALPKTAKTSTWQGHHPS
jgi:hypothetical protein